MLINPSEIPHVATEFMNTTHAEEIALINTLFEHILGYDESEESIETIDRVYTQWIEHTILHFQTEEKKMQEMRFPPYYAHKGEHDRALQEMQNVFSSWQQNRNIQALKIYMIEIVPAWFDNHVRTMDTITATFFESGFSPCSL